MPEQLLPMTTIDDGTKDTTKAVATTTPVTYTVKVVGFNR